MADQVNHVDQVNDVKRTNKSVALRVKLRAVNNSDLPVSANYTTATLAPGIAYLDFGFLEPGAMAALVGTARAGKPVSESLEGKLALRVAVGYDVLQTLHRQIGQMLADLRGKSEKS